MWQNVKSYIKSNDHLAYCFKVAYQLKMNKLINKTYISIVKLKACTLVRRIVVPKGAYAPTPLGRLCEHSWLEGKGELRLQMELSLLSS